MKMKIIISRNAGPSHQLGQREHVETFLKLILQNITNLDSVSVFALIDICFVLIIAGYLLILFITVYRES